MNLHRFFLLSAVVATVACGSDSTSPTFKTPPPAGLVRFINAVPDTGFQDFRFTDVVEGVPNLEFVNLAFRGGTNVAFQRTAVGTHHIRVFMGSSNTTAASPLGFDPAVDSTVMADTTFTFD